MLRMLTTLLAAVGMLLNTPQPQDWAAPLFRSGTLLRMHVVAHDDTLQMQNVKYAVRNAVHRCYAEERPALPMVKSAQHCLPQLCEAASQAAREAGFHGPVSVTLLECDFPERTSGHLTLPPGTYPALMVEIGDARGQNWWGLLDPELSRRFACLEPAADAPDRWNWSLQGLLRALFRLCPATEGG